ncbi:hypothetical protein ES703_81540 [subsurface metagenome]
MAALKVSGQNAAAVQEIVCELVEIWKEADPGRNTANLVLHKAKNQFLYYIFLRNPDFRTPPTLRRYKSEGVGVIEAAGECILPVPSGADEEEKWKAIREKGLEIIKGIITGNNPVADTGRIKDIYQALAQRLQ